MLTRIHWYGHNTHNLTNIQTDPCSFQRLKCSFVEFMLHGNDSGKICAFIHIVYKSENTDDQYHWHFCQK